MKKKKLFRKLFAEKNIPWILLLVAVVFSNIGLLVYANIDYVKKIKPKDVFFLDVNLVSPKIPKTTNDTIIALTTAESDVGEKKEIKFFYNRDYYKLLQRGENYKSLFEDLYLNHLRMNLDRKLGPKEIDAAETASLLDAGYTLTTPRIKRVAAKVQGLEYLFFNDLFLRRSLIKINGVPQFTPTFDKLIDLYFEMFRPVKTYQVFFPFKKPLYYTPYNFPLVNGQKVKSIYETTNSFTTSDLFSSATLEKLGKFLFNVNSIDSYIQKYDDDNPTNKMDSKRKLMQNLYTHFSSIIDSIVSEKKIPLGVLDIEKRFKGESYISLSSQTFDQRLRSYSGSIIPSHTNQSLMNDYLALDGLSFNKATNKLAITSQSCSQTYMNNTPINQLLSLTYNKNNTSEQNVMEFLSKYTTNITINGKTVKRLANCFGVLSMPSTKLGNDILIVSASNYGLHFSLPLNYLDELKKTKVSMKNLFKENLKNDLLKCDYNDGQEMQCDNARESLVAAFRGLKYFPLMFTNLFNNISILDSDAFHYIKNYQKNIQNSFEHYGMSIFKQSLSFISFETGAATSLPIEFDLRNFQGALRWGVNNEK